MNPDRMRVDPARVPNMVRRFAEVTRTADLEAAARATIQLVAELGADRVRLDLERPQQEPLALVWNGKEVAEATPRHDSPFLTMLRDRARAESAVSVVRPGVGIHWTCVAVPGASGPIGTLAVALATDSAQSVLGFAMLASALGAKASEPQESRETRWETEQQQDWYRTMDEQIRVLEGERQKFSALVNKTDAAMFVTDREGSILWANSVMARRYGGGDKRNLAGQACNILCHREGGCPDCPVRLVQEGSPVLHQERQETRDDEVRHLYVSAFPVRSPEGTVNQVLVMVQDLTDLETLRKSESRYQLLFERSADAMIMAEPDSLRIVMANRQARALLGIDPDRDPERTLLGIHPGQVRKNMEALYTGLHRGRPLDNVELEVVAAGGEIRVCNACGTTFDLDGSEVLLVEYRDVTHLHQLQAELARADHLITLGTMNAGIAHEFKNRLAPIRAFAQLIGKPRVDLDRVLRHAPLMIQEIDRMNELVRDILDYARPQEPDAVAQDLCGLVRRNLEEFREEYGETVDRNGIRLSFDPPPSLDSFVRMDASQFRRAFLNLMKNGLEATLEGECGDKALTLELAVEHGQVTLVITDTGCGIEGANLNRIFDPFFTTKGPRGTGLGMCITRSLIEANGGSIQVTSDFGSGTRVELIFPQADCSDQEAA